MGQSEQHTTSLFPDLNKNPVTVGKYSLLSSLGRSRTAEVFLARTSGPGEFSKQFAIKCILPQFNADEECLSQFESEARLGSHLCHANIVETFDFLCIGGNYFLVMEYVRGENLKSLLHTARKSDNRIPWALGAYIINEICKGLDYAHRKDDEQTGRPLKLIHRDISPKNIMIAYDGSVKIIDFGIAKAADHLKKETQLGMLKGTVSYMSPEQANGETVDQRSDIFSTAAILFELVSGEPLICDDNTLVNVKRVREWKIPTEVISSLKVPRALKNIIRKGLASDLELRFQSAAEFHGALKSFLGEISPPVSQRDIATLVTDIRNGEDTHKKKPTKYRVRRLGLAPTAAVLIGLVCILSSFAYRLRTSATLTRPTLSQQATARNPSKTRELPKAKGACTARIISRPASARLFIDSMASGKTPTRVSVPCGKPFEIAVRLEGYRPRKKRLRVTRTESRLALTLTALPNQRRAARTPNKHAK